MEDTKSNDRRPMIVDSQKTHKPPTASGLMEEIGPGGTWCREFGKAEFHGDDGQYTTASNCVEVMGIVGEPIGSCVTSVLIWHVQIWNVAD